MQDELRDQIEAMLAGELPAVLVEQTLYEHRPAAARTLPPPVRITPFDRFCELFVGEVPSHDELLPIRQDRWRLGRAKSHRQRLDVIDGAKSRFRSPLLVALLLSEVRTAVHDSPTAAGELAELAEAVALRLPAPVPAGAHALAVAYRGNALRADAHLLDARPHLDRAEQFLARERAPAWIHAEIASLRGSWLNDSRQLDSAQRHHEYAIRHFEAAGDPVGAARAWLKLAHRHSLVGDPSRAATATFQALRRLHPLSDPRLILFASHNLCIELATLGRAREAAVLLQHLTAAYSHFDDRQTFPRRSWLQAIVARASGDLERAEAALFATLRGFLDESLAFDAALAALELAILLLDQDRTDEVAAIARTLPPLFKAEGVHREALAAVLLFHRAARGRQLDRALLDRLRIFLERAQVDRAARFEA